MRIIVEYKIYLAYNRTKSDERESKLAIKIVGGMTNIIINLEQGEFPINDNFKLSCNSDFLKSKFLTGHLIETIGTMNCNSLLDKAYFYDIYDNEVMIEHIERIHLLEQSWKELQSFQLALWFVKDNSVNINNIYLNDNDLYTQSLAKSILFSLADGRYINIEFTEEELLEAKKWADKILVIRTVKSNGEKELNYENGTPYNNETHTPYENMNRFSRAIRFIIMARSTSFLPMKIACYISVLESLFDVDFELSHQVSERAAKLIGGDLDVKLANYNLVKEAYNVRSKYVHGSTIKKKKKLGEGNDSGELSSRLDNLVRTLMVKVITEHADLDEMESGDLNNWFKRLILS